MVKLDGRDQAHEVQIPIHPVARLPTALDRFPEFTCRPGDVVHEPARASSTPPPT